jgi:hypothetical protein
MEGEGLGINPSYTSLDKWISYKYGIPLYYKPFYHSTKLVLHKKEMRLDQAIKGGGNILLSGCRKKQSISKKKVL